MQASEGKSEVWARVNNNNNMIVVLLSPSSGRVSEGESRVWAGQGEGSGGSMRARAHSHNDDNMIIASSLWSHCRARARCGHTATMTM